MKETGGWPHRENYKRVVLNALQNIPAFESHYILSQYDELSVAGGVQAGRGGGAVVNNTAPSPPPSYTPAAVLTSCTKKRHLILGENVLLMIALLYKLPENKQWTTKR